MAELERLKAYYLASDSEPNMESCVARIVNVLMEQQAEIEKLRGQLAAHTQSHRFYDPWNR